MPGARSLDVRAGRIEGVMLGLPPKLTVLSVPTVVQTPPFLTFGRPSSDIRPSTPKTNPTARANRRDRRELKESDPCVRCSYASALPFRPSPSAFRHPPSVLCHPIAVLRASASPRESFRAGPETPRLASCLTALRPNTGLTAAGCSPTLSAVRAPPPVRHRAAPSPPDGASICDCYSTREAPDCAPS